MGLNLPQGAVWHIWPDCPVTRRKWYHMAVPDGEGDGISDRRFGALVAAILEHDPASMVLHLPDGRQCSIERLPPPKKDP